MLTILSLFDYTGNWAQPWKDGGYRVVLVDIKHGDDVLKIDQDWLKQYAPVFGVLAAPPCTDFSVSGAQYWKAKDADGRTEAALKLVRKTLWIVKQLQPSLSFWALENPVGRLNKLIPALMHYGPWYFEPWHYGDAYTKKTGLWGVFNRDLVRNEVEPVRVCSQGSWLMQLGGKSERTKELRSATPMGFARAFYEANKQTGVLE